MESQRTQLAYIGLGANLGDASATIELAISALAAITLTQLRTRSALFRTAPLGYTAQPDFINAVAGVATTLAPIPLLDALLDIERQFGRQRSFANAPRTLDLDLLLYGNERIATSRLTVPHPRLHERAFVLVPLADVAPMLEIPGLGRVSELLATLSAPGAAQRVERLERLGP